MPEKVFEKLKNKIPKEWKVCFFAALLIGLIAHLYKMTGWLPNWDSLVFRVDKQNMLGIGRWFLPVVCSLSSYYDLPLLNGFLCVLFHALGAVCICKIAEVKKSVTAFLIGAFVVSFPTVTSVMMYNYVADGYAIAFFLACLSAVFMTREKPKYLLSALLLTLSVGIYQAYVTVTVVLVLMYLINKLIFDGKDIKFTIKKGLCFFASGLLGMVLYYGILKLILLLFGTELLDYQGINSAAGGSGINIYDSLYFIKKIFTDYFFDFSKGISVFLVLNILIFAITFIAYINIAAKRKVLRSPVKLIALAVLAVCLVFGSMALVFINPSVDYHNLMLMGFSVFYIFFILLYEHIKNKSGKKQLVKYYVVLIISALLIFNQVVIANVSYHKAQISYEKSYGLLIRIADRIESLDEAEKCSEILVIGELGDAKAYSAYLPPDMTGITDGYIIRHDDEIVGQSVLCAALNDYCGKDYKFLAGDRKKLFLNKEEVKNMGLWPQKDCISVVDGIVVVKLGEEVIAP